MSTIAIFFDLDETLIENTIPITELFNKMYTDFSGRLGEENKNAFLGNFRVEAPVLWATMFDFTETPEQQFIDLYKRSIEATGTYSGTAAETLAQEMFDHYLDLNAQTVKFNPGAVETLNSLNKSGIKTGVITNGIEALQLNKINALGIADMVDTVTVSAQARAHKPYKPVFDLALQRAGVSSKDAWQVGDHATNDVAGGIRAGLKGVFYNPSQLCVDTAFENLQESPTHVIQHLQEIEQLLSAA